MKIELRKVSHSKSLSEETPAYSAQVWIDGSHFANVTNHGTGGPDDFSPAIGRYNDETFWTRLKAVEEQVAKDYPPMTYTAAGETHSFPASLESVCQDLLYQRDLEKTIARDLKRKVMWQKDGKVWQVTIRKGQDVATLIAAVKQKHGIGRTLNEMEPAAVAAVFRAL